MKNFVTNSTTVWYRLGFVTVRRAAVILASVLSITLTHSAWAQASAEPLVGAAVKRPGVGQSPLALQGAAATPSKVGTTSLAILPSSAATPAQWVIEPTDVRLIDAFGRWTKQAGMQLRWDAQRHVELGAVDVYEGTITQAIVAALSSASIANSDYPLEVCFYPNKPILARVTRKGEQWKDCPDTVAPAGWAMAPSR